MRYMGYVALDMLILQGSELRERSKALREQSKELLGEAQRVREMNTEEPSRSDDPEEVSM